jgi:murein tripeptide amidase MpaA
VTSRVHEENFNKIVQEEHDDVALMKYKKTVVITGRVHPGESNSSYMMEGFIRFIISNNSVARDLRAKLIFKIIPFLNPDGVMVGNYRVSMAGSDLNRRYQNPHPKLHPIICAVKKLIKEEKCDPDS